MRKIQNHTKTLDPYKIDTPKLTHQQLLSPLPHTPIVLCVGLNYKQHAEEGNLAVPTYPAIFMKPPTALSGPNTPISIHPDCQSQLDYEGELTIVIGKTGKNIQAAAYADHVLGYTVGNDVSARNFQLPASASGGQFGYAKSFDGFAPIGPCIASQEAIGGDPNKIRYWTKVNGEKRQETGTDDMIWTVGQIVEHLSRGTTLRAGTCIMTGTPSGVGVFMVSEHVSCDFLVRLEVDESALIDTDGDGGIGREDS